MPTPSTPSIDEPRRGRPRDPGRDAAILDAALDVLVEDGYDRLTIEHVAARAGVGKATIYRRWAAKAELVIDAMATIKRARFPDAPENSLDDDIEAMLKAACSPSNQRTTQVMVSICSALPREPELLEAFQRRWTDGRIAYFGAILERARERGELGPDVDIAMAASIVPSMMLQRALMTGKPAGREYAERVVHTVLLPMLGRAYSSTTNTTITPETAQ